MRGLLFANEKERNAVSRALFIVNPDAGRKEGEEMSRAVVSVLGAAFAFVDRRVSSSAADVLRWARQAREEHYDALVVMGGDGTASLGLRGVLDGAADNDELPALCVLPGGTGNGFVRTLGIGSDAVAALRAYDFSRTVPLDVCFVNGSPFVYSVTGGPLPEGIRAVPSETKSRFGVFAYMASELSRVGNGNRHALRIAVDGEKHVETVSSFVVFSANALVNDFTSIPRTRFDDGQLYFMALRSASLPALVSLVPHVFSRTLECSRQVVLLRGTSIEMESLDGDLRCGIDGDDGPLTPISLRIDRGRMRMFAVDAPHGGRFSACE